MNEERRKNAEGLGLKIVDAAGGDFFKKLDELTIDYGFADWGETIVECVLATYSKREVQKFQKETERQIQKLEAIRLSRESIEGIYRSVLLATSLPYEEKERKLLEFHEQIHLSELANAESASKWFLSKVHLLTDNDHEEGEN